jgi:hypothetical protein
MHVIILVGIIIMYNNLKKCATAQHDYNSDIIYNHISGVGYVHIHSREPQLCTCADEFSYFFFLWRQDVCSRYYMHIIIYILTRGEDDFYFWTHVAQTITNMYNLSFKNLNL